MEYIYKFIFEKDCDFHKKEFHYLASLELSDFDDINKLNKRLKRDLTINPVRLNNIERKPNKVIFIFNVSTT